MPAARRDDSVGPAPAGFRLRRHPPMSDLSFLKEWIHQRGSPGPGGPGGMVREFEQFFSYIFNNSPDGISILDLDFRILGVNTVMERWYEHEAPIVGRTCHEVYHGRRTPCESCPTAACIRSGKPQVATRRPATAGRRSCRCSRCSTTPEGFSA
jgi:PAS domain-containing protein